MNPAERHFDRILWNLGRGDVERLLNCEYRNGQLHVIDPDAPVSITRTIKPLPEATS